jgi:hypothetical protein
VVGFDCEFAALDRWPLPLVAALSGCCANPQGNYL